MPTSDETPEAQRARIKTLTLTARATWFGYLAALAFAGVTLLGIRDQDFFSADSSTQLPLINVSVPVTSFFAAGAPLIALIFGYLHVFLEKLWAELASAKKPTGGRTLSSEIQPWLISDFALHVRRTLKDEHQNPPIKRTALGLLGTGVTFTLGWIGGPLVMFGFWYTSMPAHMVGLTIWLGILFAITLWTACASLAALRRNMLAKHQGTTWHPSLQLMAVVCLSLPIVLASDLRTRKDLWDDPRRPQGYTGFLSHPKHWFRPVSANLAEVTLTELPRDHLDYNAARQEFFLTWCKGQGDAECDGITVEDAGAQFLNEWEARRNTYVRTLRKPILSGRDLVGADLRQAHLVGIKLDGANLSHAVLSRAALEAVDLSGAQMQGADFWYAQMQEANLRRAQMQGAKLNWAQMQGADLIGAQMQGADLRWAQMQGADLEGAQMQGANLGWAQMQGADLGWAQMQGADLRWAQMQGAELRWAQMQGAKLNWAQMQGAGLRWALLTGTADEPMVLQSTNLSASTNHGGALRFVDMSEAILDDRTDFRNSFADASVEMPEGFARPCQWAKTELPDDQFFGRWRGWRETSDDPSLWELFAPEGLKNASPIPPPEGCVWKTGPLNPE